jgi:hypothetical protein
MKSTSRPSRFLLHSLVATVLGSTSLHAAAVVYESFSQDISGGANLTSKAGGSGINTWTGTGSSTTIVTEDLTYGDLSHTGRQLDMTGNNIDAYVTTTSALGDAGLLDNGATLWFSFMYSKTSNNGGNEKGGFAFGSERIDGAFNGTNMINGGNAIGVGITGGSIFAAGWVGDGNFSGGTGSTEATPINTSLFVVGRITWGATGTDTESIDLFLPDTSDLSDLPTEFSSLSMAAVDQTLFDTISMTTHQSQGTISYDEIRFGATYADVSPIPEPRVALIGSLALLALIRRRR